MISAQTEYEHSHSPQGSWAGAVPWKARTGGVTPRGNRGAIRARGNHAHRRTEAEQETHAALVQEWRQAHPSTQEPTPTLEVAWEGQVVGHQRSSLSGLSLSQKVVPPSLVADAAPGWVEDFLLWKLLGRRFEE